MLKSKIQTELSINGIVLKLNSITNLPYQPRLKERAKALRRAENLPEVLFWTEVIKKRFHKIDFDRQRIIGNYIVDFYIRALGLIIEIDGASHDDKEVYDKIREEYLISLGLKVYRISVDDVMRNMDLVVMELEEYLFKEYGVEK
ncbi:very-short-patch-repair endonuclease [Pedobacter sp. UYP30]|uniref:endonuclease domain-containing protein n=1 Tax=Pedobacter sp. UYP30 TaxID=1756400 RepID=UPI00339370C6